MSALAACVAHQRSLLVCGVAACMLVQCSQVLGVTLSCYVRASLVCVTFVLLDVCNFSNKECMSHVQV